MPTITKEMCKQIKDELDNFRARHGALVVRFFQPERAELKKEFREFMKKDQTVEAMNFLDAVNDLVKGKEEGGKITAGQINSLLNTYVKQGGAEEINIPATSRQPVIETARQLEEKDPPAKSQKFVDSLVRAIYDVNTLVVNDVGMRFIRDRQEIREEAEEVAELEAEVTKQIAKLDSAIEAFATKINAKEESQKNRGINKSFYEEVEKLKSDGKKSWTSLSTSKTRLEKATELTTVIQREKIAVHKLESLLKTLNTAMQKYSESTAKESRGFFGKIFGSKSIEDRVAQLNAEKEAFLRSLPETLDAADGLIKKADILIKDFQKINAALSSRSEIIASPRGSSVSSSSAAASSTQSTANTSAAAPSPTPAASAPSPTPSDSASSPTPPPQEPPSPSHK